MIGISEYKKQLSKYKLGICSCNLHSSNSCLHFNSVYCYFECGYNLSISKNLDNMVHNLQCRDVYKCYKDLRHCSGVDDCKCDVFDMILKEVSL